VNNIYEEEECENEENKTMCKWKYRRMKYYDEETNKAILVVI